MNNKSLYFEKAIKQGNFVEITSSNLSSDTTQYHTEIYNIDKLEDFIKNIKDRKPTKIRIVKYASEHGVIWANKLYDLEYNGEKIIDTVYDVYSNPNAFLPSTIYYFDQIIKRITQMIYGMEFVQKPIKEITALLLPALKRVV